MLRRSREGGPKSTLSRPKLGAYYGDPSVLKRMVEFLGGSPASAVYVTALNKADDLHWPVYPPEMLGDLLADQCDVSRSLWDRRHLLVDLDVEYVNFDFPGECYLDPFRAFEIQRPVEQVTEEVLLELGIVPLHLMSGRGHHFLWQVRQDSPAFERLVSLAPESDYAHGLYDVPRPPHREPVGKDLGRAHEAVGLVLEHLTHEIRRRASFVCPVPIELTAVRCAPGDIGKEMVSLDLSEYGDPIHTRLIRIPFSRYLKPWKNHWKVGADVLDALSPLFTIPRHELGLTESLQAMRSPRRIAALARCASTAIPDGSAPMETALAQYEQSDIAAFHETFYEEEHEPVDHWPETYDALSLDSLPPCVRHILAHPNDLLMQPAAIQQVTRVLMAMEWHPRHIAGLIRSKYERDVGWGHRWYVYSAGMRADFYARLFGGCIELGYDNLLNMDCRSTAERGLCYEPTPNCNLDELRTALVERRCHE